jgi:hypothetical protein
MEVFMPYSNTEDKRIRDKWYYNNNKHKWKQRKKQRVAVVRRLLFRVKRFCGCFDCKESDPCCLDFHHVCGIKQFDVAHGLSRSWKQLKQEIRKCIVVCANCHRKRHAKERKKEGRV